VGGNDDPTRQSLRVEHLELARVRVSGVGQEAEVAGVGGERDQSRGVGGRARDDVDHLHVADVVDVQTLLQTDNKSRSVHPNCPDLVIVRIAANFSSFLEMANPESSWIGCRHDRHQAAAEQPLRNVHVGFVIFMDEVHGICGVDAVEMISRTGPNYDT